MMNSQMHASYVKITTTWLHQVYAEEYLYRVQHMIDIRDNA